jgi:hypothetical protein
MKKTAIKSTWRVQLTWDIEAENPEKALDKVMWKIPVHPTGISCLPNDPIYEDDEDDD